MQLEVQSERIADLERVVPKEFEVMHYNVLADQAGQNMQPWFCYGADVTNEERQQLHRNFYANGNANKRAADKGWPSWAESVLSPERIAAVENYHERVFAWERRKHALWGQVMSHKVGCVPSCHTNRTNPRSLRSITSCRKDSRAICPHLFDTHLRAYMLGMRRACAPLLSFLPSRELSHPIFLSGSPALTPTAPAAAHGLPMS